MIPPNMRLPKKPVRERKSILRWIANEIPQDSPKPKRQRRHVDPDADVILTPSEAADYLGTTLAALTARHIRNVPPKRTGAGYRIADLDAFLASETTWTYAEPGGASPSKSAVGYGRMNRHVKKD